MNFVGPPKQLIIVGGPTASGKTAMAIRLAQYYDAPILSADSRQFYREMAIGTARPSEAELSQARHFFVADRSVEQALSAGEYAREANELLADLYQRHDVAILVGGSGLFIKALTAGLDPFPPVSDEVRREVEALFQEQGIIGLQMALAAADPAYFAAVDQQNPARLMRALAVCRAAGRPYSDFLSGEERPQAFQPIFLQLHLPRPELYERINQRVTDMMARGLLEEARSLYDRRQLAPLQTVGYQELFAHLDGEYSLERAVELIQQNTRRYAKRQLTWLRRDGYWKHLRPDEEEMAIAYIEFSRRTGLRIQRLTGDDRPRIEAWLGERGVEGWPELGKSVYLALVDQDNKNFHALATAPIGEPHAPRLAVTPPLDKAEAGMFLTHELHLLMEEIT